MRLAAAIRCGKICAGCGGGQCRDDKTLHRLQCTECEGAGCSRCEGRGHMPFVGCAMQEARPMFKALQLFDMADKGHLPVAGGSLDQSAWFVSAYSQYTSDVSNFRADR